MDEQQKQQKEFDNYLTKIIKYGNEIEQKLKEYSFNERYEWIK